MLAPDDEVVADSEEEDNLLPADTSNSLYDMSFTRTEIQLGTDPIIQTASLNSRSRSTSISAFTSTTYGAPAHVASTCSGISSFSVQGAIPAAVEARATVVKSRPKPRPAYKGSNASTDDTSSIVAVDTSTMNATAGPSNTKFGFSMSRNESIGIDDISLSLADRAKLRSRTGASKSAPTPPNAETKPEHNTSEFRTKPKRKKIATASVDDSDVIELTSEDEVAQPNSKSSTISKPTASSKAFRSINASPLDDLQPFSDSQGTITTLPILSSSFLSPSDPPTPSTLLTLTPPPFSRATHLNASNDVLNSPNAGTAKGRKRKRPKMHIPDLNYVGNEFARMDVGEQLVRKPSEDSRRMPPPPPPPPFFASSSPKRSEAGHGMVVDTSRAEYSERSGQPKKRKGKKGTDDLNYGSGSGGDVDIAHTEPAKNKKQKKVNVKEGERDVEVVIRTKKKTKAKDKAAAPTAPIKGAYKSKEFIDDDEGEDPLALFGLVQPKPLSITSASVALAARTTSPDLHVDSEDEIGFISRAPSRTKTPKSSGSSRKRKAIEDSDDELAVAEPEPTLAPSSRRLARSRASKVFVLPEDQVLEDGAWVAEEVPSVINKVSKVKKGRERDNGKTKKAKTKEKETPDPPKTFNFVNHRTELDHPTEEGKTNDLEVVKENLGPDLGYLNRPAPSSALSSSKSISRTFSIPRKSTPMSELIRRVNSLPGSPFTPSTKGTSQTGTAYSPMLKSSRSMLSRIAPLHLTRKPPPPPPPPVPKAKERKTKKMLEMEEKWEDELSETVDGWSVLEESERVQLRRRKKEMELGGYDD